jgi:hypothetical protein
MLVFALIAVAFIATVASVGSGGSGPARPRHAASPSAPAGPTVVGAGTAPARPRARAAHRPRHHAPVTDPQDSDPRLRRALRQSQGTGQAFQHLPYAGDGITVDYGERGSDGRVTLTVTYLGGRAAARQSFARFLRRWRDDGAGYRVAYRRSAGTAP